MPRETSAPPRPLPRPTGPAPASPSAYDLFAQGQFAAADVPPPPPPKDDDAPSPRGSPTATHAPRPLPASPTQLQRSGSGRTVQRPLPVPSGAVTPPPMPHVPWRTPHRAPNADVWHAATPPAWARAAVPRTSSPLRPREMRSTPASIAAWRDAAQAPSPKAAHDTPAAPGSPPRARYEAPSVFQRPASPGVLQRPGTPRGSRPASPGLSRSDTRGSRPISLIHPDPPERPPRPVSPPLPSAAPRTRPATPPDAAPAPLPATPPRPTMPRGATPPSPLRPTPDRPAVPLILVDGEPMTDDMMDPAAPEDHTPGELSLSDEPAAPQHASSGSAGTAVSEGITSQCRRCGRWIGGAMVRAMGHAWHARCFTCAHCATPLEHVSFYEHDGEPYCHLDYHELFSRRCHYCQTPIVDERFVTVEALGGRTYHELHFFCASCGEPFVDPKDAQTPHLGDDSEELRDLVRPFYVHKRHAYCETCHVRLHRPRCKACGQPVADAHVRAMRSVWHPACFVCTRCRRPFSGAVFVAPDGSPCDLDCYQAWMRGARGPAPPAFLGA